MKKLFVLSMLMWCFKIGFTQSVGTAVGTQSGRVIGNSSGQNGLGSLLHPNLYDGTAVVNIPIFDHSVSELSLGVGLTYDTHGIRVDERASNVGLGWNLSVGGSITREVKGIEDEVSYTYEPANWQNGANVYCGIWYGDRNKLYQAQFDQETQYDLFTLNLPGRSIEFELDVDEYGGLSARTNPQTILQFQIMVENAETLPSGQYMYERYNKSNTKNLMGFKVTDEYGNNYIFSRGDYDTKVVFDSTYYPCTKWNLTEIITNTNQHIKYTYVNYDVDYPVGKLEQVREIYTEINWPNAGQHYDPGTELIENKVIRYTGRRTYLSKIEYPSNVEVNFQYRENQCALDNVLPLDNIRISDGYGIGNTNTLQFKFDYSFYHSPWKTFSATEIPYKTCSELHSFYAGESTADIKEQINLGTRLKLNSIKMVGKDGVTTEPYYHFEYDQGLLPRRLNPGKDYYGYYNGKLSTTFPVWLHGSFSNLSIPLHNSVHGWAYGVDKTPDFNYAIHGILKKVHNGTGGTLEIKYKEHVLTNPAHGYVGCTYSGTVPPATVFPTYEYETANDGICLDETIMTDIYSPDNTTTTRYEFSGGQRFFRGGFSWTQWGSLTTDPTHTLEGRIYSNNVITPMQLINGSNHGYSTAEVKRYNHSNQYQGGKKYQFSNLMLDAAMTKSNLRMSANTRDNHYPIQYFIPTRMGKVVEESTLDFQGNCTSKSSIDYIDYIDYTRFIAQQMSQVDYPYRSFQSKVEDQSTEIGYRSFYNSPYLPSQVSDHQYTNSGTFTKTQSFIYDERHKVKEIKWYDDDGNLNVKSLKYLHNYGNRYSFLANEQLWKAVNGVGYLIARTDNIFADLFYPGIYPRPQLKGKAIFKYGAPYGGPTPDDHMVKTEEITVRDSKQNALEIKYEEKDVYTSAIWDTNASAGKIDHLWSV